ncbi:MAG: hypothetical protein JRE29_03415 [Deltaproteobacteria bacterium]|nr:hypothetical protein [Deltaproteobacteria bacterium]
MNRHKIMYCIHDDPLDRRFWKISTMVSFILKASVLLGFVIYLQGCDTLKTTKETKNMPMPKKISVEQPAKPPLDVSTPEKTETATFALG